MGTGEIQKLMRQAVGFILLTFSLLSLPKAFSGAVILMVIMNMGFPVESDIDRLVTTNQTQHLGSAIGNLGSFIILALLARWIFRGPKILERWLNEEQSESDKTNVPTETNEMKEVD